MRCRDLAGSWTWLSTIALSVMVPDLLLGWTFVVRGQL